jgi:hypothetical protein
VGIVRKASDKIFPHVAAVAFGNVSLEWEKTLQKNTASEGVLKLVTLKGLMGVEYNFSTNQLSVG